MTKTDLQKEWEIRIAEYRASGLSGAKWCAANNVKPNRLWYWLAKFKAGKDPSFANPIQWLPVEVSGQPPVEHSNALLINVGKASIEVKPGFDQDLLSNIIRTLVALC